MANQIKLRHQRGPNRNQVIPPDHIPLNKRGALSVGGVMDHIKNMISLIPLKPPVTTSNPNFNQPCSHCYTYGHDKDHYFTLHPELQ